MIQEDPRVGPYEWKEMSGKVFVWFLEGSAEASQLASVACSRLDMQDATMEQKRVIVQVELLGLVTEGILREFPLGFTSVDIPRLFESMKWRDYGMGGPTG